MNRYKLKLNDFKRIEIEDIDRIQKHLNSYGPETCDYSMVNLYSWGHYHNVKWKECKDRLLLYNFDTGFMLYPVGPAFSTREMICLSDNIVEEGGKGNFISIPEFYAHKHKSLKKYFEVIEEISNSDYLYLTEKLAELKGRKLHKKKNLISQFERNYGDFETRAFEKNDFDMCLELTRKWSSDHKSVCDSEKEVEMKVMCLAMEKSHVLGLEGLLLFCEDKLIAFSLFSELKPDTADIHFEKYDFSYKGASQLINRETARYLQGRYKYINREQDIGKKGLRKAKMSYQPLKLVPTYRLIRK